MKKLKVYCSWILPGLVIFILDRISKALLYDAETVIWPCVLALNGTRNTGMAMGILAGHPVLLAVLSVVLLAACLVLLLKKSRISGWAVIAVSLIAGGALGNLIDRIFLGYVIDMIEVLFIDFYIFNVADIGVVCGALLCGFSLLFRPQEWSRK